MSDPEVSRPDGSGDPRLEIPEVLRTPVRRPASIEQAAGTSVSSPASDRRDKAQMAAGWAIALNFVYGVVGAGLIGWIIQKWIFPSWAHWALLAGLMIGLIGGFARFIQEAMRANAQDSRGPTGRKK